MRARAIGLVALFWTFGSSAAAEPAIKNLKATAVSSKTVRVTFEVTGAASYGRYDVYHIHPATWARLKLPWPLPSRIIKTLPRVHRILSGIARPRRGKWSYARNLEHGVGAGDWILVVFRERGAAATGRVAVTAGGSTKGESLPRVMTMWLKKIPGFTTAEWRTKISAHPRWALYKNRVVIWRDDKFNYYRVKLQVFEQVRLIRKLKKLGIHKLTADEIRKRELTWVRIVDAGSDEIGIDFKGASNKIDLGGPIRFYAGRYPDNEPLQRLKKIHDLLFDFRHRRARPYKLPEASTGQSSAR